MKRVRVARIHWEIMELNLLNLFGCSRDILDKAKRYYFDRVHSKQKVLEVIRPGRLVIYWRPRISKTSSRNHQGHVH
jgi:hypothetical protein